MHFIHTRLFDKRFKRLESSLKARAEKRQELFAQNRRHPLLDDHALHEPYLGCRSFSVTGDVRIIYKPINDTTCLLVTIGTHHELYGS
jgi:mRNA-degrading endonuclease YafQ of YafQ-DinJ toxin-antitoxin module